MTIQTELEILREQVAQWQQRGEVLTRRMEALEARLVEEEKPAPGAAVVVPAQVSEPAAALPPPLPPMLPATPTLPVPGVAAHAAAPAVEPAPTPFREPQGPSLGQRLGIWLKQFGPQEEMDLETKIWWWLARVGIVVLVMGVVGLMAYAIDQLGQAWWMPYFRIALGYVFCATLLVLGKRLEHRMRSYARVLISGGIALSYFVTFATHYVPYTRIFARPEPTLVLLTLVVIAWAGIAQWRKSVMVAAAVTALGHFTVAMSTLSLATPSRFAVGGLLALSIMSAWFLARNGWYLVAAVGMVGSYLNHFFWLSRAPASELPMDFIVAMAVLAAYFLVFALAEYLSPDTLRREKVRFSIRSTYASFNSGAFFVLGRALMLSFPFTHDYTYAFYFAFAGGLAAFGFLYWLKRAADPMHNLYFTKAASVFTLGLATYFDGATLTAWLAVESVVLMMGARRSGLLVSRLLAHCAAFLAFAQGLHYVMPRTPYADPAYPGLAAAATVTVLALLAGSLLYLKTDWSRRSPKLLRIPRSWLPWAWKLDLLAEPRSPEWKKPLEGLLFPYLYAFFAVFLGLIYAQHLLTLMHGGPALASLALALTLAGVYVRSKPFTSAALLWSTAATFFWCNSAFGYRIFLKGGVTYRHHEYFLMLACGSLVALSLLLLAEFPRWFRSREADLWPRVSLRFPSVTLADFHILCLYATLLLASRALVEPQHAVLAFAAAAAAAAVYAFLQPAPALGLLALLLSLSAPLFYTGPVLNVAAPEVLFPALALLFVPAVLVGRGVAASRPAGLEAVPITRPGLARLQRPIPPYVLYGSPAWLYAAYYVGQTEVEATHSVLALAAGAALLLVACGWLHTGACSGWAAFLLLVGMEEWGGATDLLSPFPSLTHAAALCVVLCALLGERWVAGQGDRRARAQQIALQVIAWMQLYVYAEALLPEDWFYAACLLLAFGWAAWAVLMRTRTAVILSIAIALLGTGATIVFSYDGGLQTLPMAMAYLGAVVYWAGAERIGVWLLHREKMPGWAKWPVLQPFLVALPVALLLMLLERIPALANYVTISWTAGAVLVLLFGLTVRERWYRYASMIAFFLAIGHVLLVDMRSLSPLFRVAALIVLGAVLLAVAYGYVSARQRGKREKL